MKGIVNTNVDTRVKLNNDGDWKEVEYVFPVFSLSKPNELLVTANLYSTKEDFTKNYHLNRQLSLGTCELKEGENPIAVAQAFVIEKLGAGFEIESN